MATVSLNDLVTPISPTEATATILSVAQALGLQTTAWQPLGMARTILATQGQISSDYSKIVNFIAQGGYVSYAALMVDTTGNPITTWMTLVAKNMFNVDRIDATFAMGPVPIINASGTTYTFAAGQFHLSNSITGKSFSNTTAISITPGTTNSVMKADEAGSASSQAAGTVLALVTPLVGVSVGALVTDMVGNDEESNQALLLRCQAKLGALSPNGPSQAYYFVATTTVTPSGNFINRVSVTSNTSTGVVTVYLANAAGVPSGPDIAAIDAAIQAQVVPDGVTAIVAAATQVLIVVTANVWVPTATGLAAPQIQTACGNALTTYFSNLPIGGVLDNNSGIFVVPLNEIEATIYNAIVKLAPGFSSRITVISVLPSGDVVLTPNEVAVLSTVTINVNFT